MQRLSSNPLNRIRRDGLWIAGVLAIAFSLIGPMVPNALALYFVVQGGMQLDNAFVVAGGSSGALGCRIHPLTDRAAVEHSLQAVGQLKAALTLNPKEPQVYLLLGRSYCALGDFQMAVEAYRGYSRLRPSNPLGTLEMGLAFEALGDSRSAARAWESSGLSGQNFLDRGLSALEANRIQEAEDWFKHAGSMGYPGIDLYKGLVEASAYEREGLWDEAITSYRQSIEASQDSSAPLGTAFYRMGLIQQNELKEWDKALSSYQNAVRSGRFLADEDEADTYYRRGIILKYGYDRPLDAVQDFSQATRIVPNHYGALMELGWSYWELNGDFAKSEQVLRAAIAANPQAKYAYERLGDLYSANGNFSVALSTYERALRVAPDDAQVQQKVTETRLKMANPKVN